MGQKVIPSLKLLLVALSEGDDLSGHKFSTVDGISVSFLTPPHVTHQTLVDLSTVEDYKSLIKGLWFQPGSYDQNVLDKVTEIGLEDRAIHEDECILVRGEAGLYNTNL